MCPSSPLPHDAQRDTEKADIEKERKQQQKGPAAQAAELEVGIRGVPALPVSKLSSISSAVLPLLTCGQAATHGTTHCCSLWAFCLAMHRSVTARLVMQHAPCARIDVPQELTQIYVARGLDPDLARRVAEQLTEKDVIRAHARDELGIDIDELANPLQAGVVSALAFTAGGSGWWSGAQPLAVQNAMTTRAENYSLQQYAWDAYQRPGCSTTVRCLSLLLNSRLLPCPRRPHPAGVGRVHPGQADAADRADRLQRAGAGGVRADGRRPGGRQAHRRRTAGGCRTAGGVVSPRCAPGRQLFR